MVRFVHDDAQEKMYGDEVVRQTDAQPGQKHYVKYGKDPPYISMLLPAFFERKESNQSSRKEKADTTYRGVLAKREKILQKIC